MLDSVVKLTEKVTELLKYRSERRARRFVNIVEPMYANLKVIHQDYLRIFEGASTDLQSDRQLAEVAAVFKTRRIEEEAERRAILEHARTFAEDARLADFRLFFSSVIDYFTDTPFSGGNTPSNRLALAVAAAAGEERFAESARSLGDERRRKLEDAIELSLRMLRRNWEQVSTAYAALRSASTS